MLEYENAAVAEQIVVENEIYDLLGAIEIVWRIGENYVELFVAALQIEKRVCLYGVEIVEPDRSRRLPNEVVMYGIDLNRCHAVRISRGKFIAYGSCPRKQVEHVAFGKIHQIVEHVKQILLGEIRRGTRPQIFGRDDGPSAVFSAYYSHTICLKIGLHTLISPAGSPSMTIFILYIWYAESSTVN